MLLTVRLVYPCFCLTAIPCRLSCGDAAAAAAAAAAATAAAVDADGAGAFVCSFFFCWVFRPQINVSICNLFAFAVFNATSVVSLFSALFFQINLKDDNIVFGDAGRSSGNDYFA